MRAALLALLLLAAAFTGGGALAAPTCLTRNADTIRCGAPGAMPADWKPSAQLLWDRKISRPAEQDFTALVKVLGGIALLLAMIALIPKFDGSKGEDWDRHEGDEEKRG